MQEILFVGHSVSFWFNEKYYQMASGCLQQPAPLGNIINDYFAGRCFFGCGNTTGNFLSMAIVFVEWDQ